MARRAKNEFFVLEALGICMLCSLRAEVEPRLSSVDASPTALGGCEAPVPRSVAEVWRRGMRVGYHTTLDRVPKASVMEAGKDNLLSCSKEDLSETIQESAADSGGIRAAEAQRGAAGSGTASRRTTLCCCIEVASLARPCPHPGATCRSEAGALRAKGRLPRPCAG